MRPSAASFQRATRAPTHSPALQAAAQMKLVRMQAYAAAKKKAVFARIRPNAALAAASTTFVPPMNTVTAHWLPEIPALLTPSAALAVAKITRVKRVTFAAVLQWAETAPFRLIASTISAAQIRRTRVWPRRRAPETPSRPVPRPLTATVSVATEMCASRTRSAPVAHSAPPAPTKPSALQGAATTEFVRL